ALTLTDVTTANGPISVSASGDLTASQVVSQTSSAANSITLITTNGGAISAGVINAGAQGNVSLNSATTITAQAGSLITASQLTARAAGAITLDTAVGSLDAQTSSSGDLTVLQTTALDATNLSTSAGNISVTTQAGDINFGTITAGAPGSVTLTAAGGIQPSSDSASLTGDSINLTANAGDIGSAAVPANLSVGTGSVAATAHGSIFLGASTGDLPLGNLSAGGNIVLTTDKGSITSQTGTQVSAHDLSVSAAGGVTLNTAVAALDVATTATGDVSITQQGVLDLTNLSTTDGSITVTASGNLTAPNVVSQNSTASNGLSLTTTNGGNLILGAINAGAQGDVTLNSAGAISAQSGSLITANRVTAQAVGDITLDTSAASVSAVTSAAGNITISAQGDLELTNVTTANGAITVTDAGNLTATNVVSQTSAAANTITLTTTNGGDLSAGVINAGAQGNVTLTSAGRTSALVNSLITANQLTVRAAGPVTLDTAVGAVDVATSAPGDINVSQQGDVSLTHVTAANGAITVTASGNLTANQVISQTSSVANSVALTTSNGGTITLGTINAGAQGNVSLHAAGLIAVQPAGLVTANQLLVRSAGAVTLTTQVASLDATVSAPGDFTLAQQGDLTVSNLSVANGAINVTVNGNLTATKISLLSSTASSGLNLTTTGGGSMTLANISVGTATNMTLTSAGGIGVLPGDTLTANLLTVRSVNGLTLNTAVTSLDVAISGTGPINITNTGPLTLVNAQTANGSISVTASGKLVASQVISQTSAPTNPITLTTTADGQATTDAVQTLQLGGAVNVGDIWAVTLGGVPIAYTVQTNDTLPTIAAGLAGQINTVPGYAAVAQGALISVSNVAGQTFTLSGTPPTGASMTVGTTAAEAAINLSGKAVSGEVWTLEVDGTAYPYTVTAANPSLNTVATALAQSLNAVSGYAAVAQGPVIFVTQLAGAALAASATVSGAPISVGIVNAGSKGNVTLDSAGALTALSAGQATTNAVQTLQLGGAVNAGDTWAVTLSGVSVNYIVQTNDTLATVAAGLAGQINAVAGYAAVAQGPLISLSNVAGHIFTLSGTPPTGGSMTVGATTAEAAINLSGKSVAGEVWTLEVDGTAYPYTVTDANPSLSSVATALAQSLNSVSGYAAVTQGSVIFVTKLAGGTLVASATVSGAALSANELIARAAGPVSLDTAVGSVDAATSAPGAITLLNTGAVAVVNLQTNLGDISLTASGNVTSAAGDNIVALGNYGDGGEILLHATSGNLDLAGNVNANGYAASRNGGTITLVADAGSLKVSNVSSLGGGGSGVGGLVQFSAPAGITQYSGTAVTAGSLKLLSAGTVTLTNINSVSILAAALTGAGSNLSFTNGAALVVTTLAAAGALGTPVVNLAQVAGITTAGGNVTVTVTNGSLAVNAPVTAEASGTISLTTTGSGNGVALNAALSSTSGQITLNSAGAIAEAGAGAGVISTNGLLQTSSTTGQMLTNANTVGSFNATNTTSGDVSLVNT
ncbi:MAG: beta strand repeat-containing protein, partial [Terriglobales bacterium]